MGLAEEDRAIARSDEPEARSAGCWRERATGDTHDELAARWPTLASCPESARWLALQLDLGRSSRTVQAYARSLVDYLGYCDRASVDVIAAARAEIAGYVRDLRERPSRHGANVITLNSGAGLSNATLQLRMTVLRLSTTSWSRNVSASAARSRAGIAQRMAGPAGVVWSPGSIRCGDAITSGTAAEGGPFEFYDLGHAYCTYTFFEQCPHRMACARCGFYLPKNSSSAQLLEATTACSGCSWRSRSPTKSRPPSKATSKQSRV